MMRQLLLLPDDFRLDDVEIEIQHILIPEHSEGDVVPVYKGRGYGKRPTLERVEFFPSGERFPLERPLYRRRRTGEKENRGGKLPPSYGRH